MAKGTIHLNVELSAVADEEGKFGRLATLLGLADADHARGKCEHLWVACTRRGEADLPQWLVEQILGERGPEALIEAELATWSAGRGDSSCRRLKIGGAAKHCLWMSSSKIQLEHEQRSKGGKSRAKTSSRQLDGTFAPAGDNHPADHPAQSSSSEIATKISPEVPPARDPAVPSTSPTPGIPDRNSIREALRSELQTARNRAGAARATEVKPLLAFDRGIDSDLTGRLALCVTFAALELLAGQARHAIAMAELEVTHGGKSFEWFTGAIFSGGNFSRLVGMTSDDATRERSPPTGRKAPRSIHVGRVEPLPSEQYTESGDQKI